MLNTYGVMPGKASKIVNSLLEKRGLRTIACHALMLSENYPPFIAQGVTGTDQPGAKQMAAFHQFILELGGKLEQIRAGVLPEKAKVKLDIFSRLIPVKSRSSVLKEMGALKLDAALCTQCGQCAQSCGYHAIRMEGNPVFEPDQCRGCWACFNHCPQKAIYTDKVKATAQYAGPGRQLIGKLG
jgi:ferredoxin